MYVLYREHHGAPPLKRTYGRFQIFSTSLSVFFSLQKRFHWVWSGIVVLGWLDIFILHPPSMDTKGKKNRIFRMSKQENLHQN